MKLERRLKRKGGDLVLELTPLIDIVFLLLIFFMFATSMEDVKSGIKIDLPQSSAREVTNIKELQIIIAENKSLYLTYKENGKSIQRELSKESLVGELQDIFKSNKQKNVLISADKKIDYGYVVEIMSLAREGGATSLDIGTANVEVN